MTGIATAYIGLKKRIVLGLRSHSIGFDWLTGALFAGLLLLPRGTQRGGEWAKLINRRLVIICVPFR